MTTPPDAAQIADKLTEAHSIAFDIDLTNITGAYRISYTDGVLGFRKITPEDYYEQQPAVRAELEKK